MFILIIKNKYYENSLIIVHLVPASPIQVKLKMTCSFKNIYFVLYLSNDVIKCIFISYALLYCYISIIIAELCVDFTKSFDRAAIA